MHDSVDIKSAKLALDDAIDSLETAIGPILSRIKALEATASDTEVFKEDRAKLAAQLDEMAAKTEESATQAAEEILKAEQAKSTLARREEEFAVLARDSEAELDRVMSIIHKAMEA